MGLMAKIITSIDGEGNVETRVEGVSGPACINITDGINKALGRVIDRRLTDEYEEDTLDAPDLDIHRR
jgi:hypothetical protein